MPATKRLPFCPDELKVVVIITALLFLGLLGTDIHLSALPEMMRFMHTSQQLMQSSISVFLLGVGLSALVYGPLSDKFGTQVVPSQCSPVLSRSTCNLAQLFLRAFSIPTA